MKRFLVVASLAVAALGAVSVPDVGAASSLKFTGKISGGDYGTNLLFIASDGTAVRAIPDGKGAFSVAVPSTLVENFRRFPGTAAVVLHFGYYDGPVNFGGSWRLTEKLPAEVNLGTVKVSDGDGGSASVPASLKLRGSTRVRGQFNKAKYGDMMWTDSAGDADTDGVPNVFDADADGNGVPDSSQLSQDYKPAAKDMGKLNSRNVLAINFGTDAWLQAQFRDNQKSGTPVNTNIVPDGTLEELQAYQDSALRIETGADISKGKSAFFDCAGHTYCGGEGTMPMLPSEWDTQKSWGRVEAPLILSGTGHLSPEGHTGLVITKKGSKVLSQKVAAVTGSVTAPAVLASVGGAKVSYPLNPSTSTLGNRNLGALTIELFRPQVLRTKPALFMADRGGFLYQLSAWIDGKQGPCRAKNIEAGPGLIAVDTKWKDENSGQTFWDSASSPSNGERLTFTIDVNGCAANGKSPYGDTASIGFSVNVFDSRNTRMNIYYSVSTR